MKNFIFSLLAVSIIFLSMSNLENNEAKEIGIYKPVAVVELFTSQGCSSCPPADRLLSSITNQNKENIYTLSFHVDYWNYLGWKDPYSQESFSQRQRRYAQQLNAGVYTPQMVVNGKAEFVGSKTSIAENAIKRALLQSATAKLSIYQSDIKDGKATIKYEVESKKVPDQVINIALVERHVSTSVKRGENGGRTLNHDNVVRAFKTAFNTSGTVSLNLPSDLNLENTSVIGYIQNHKSGEIQGASRTVLEQK